VPKLTDKPSVAITIAPGLLVRAIKDAMKFVSGDDNRFVMKGLLWEIGKGTLSVTASDGKRLYKETIDVEVKATKTVKPIVDMSGCVNLLSKMVGVGMSMVTIDIYDKEKAVIRAGQFELRVPCIDGAFPDTNKLLAEEKTCIAYNMAGLQGAIKYLKQFAKRDEVSVHLYKDKATLNEGVYDKVAVNEVKGLEAVKGIRGADLNPCLVTLTIQNDATDGTIAIFNLKYLADAVALMGDRARVLLNKESGYSYWIPARQGWL
jgi:DNA polymerase III sliding clamp (beta) subunit (PCNA family)